MHPHPPPPLEAAAYMANAIKKATSTIIDGLNMVRVRSSEKYINNGRSCIVGLINVSNCVTYASMARYSLLPGLLSSLRWTTFFRYKGKHTLSMGPGASILASHVRHIMLNPLTYDWKSNGRV